MTIVRHEVTNMRPGVTIVRPQESRVTNVRPHPTTRRRQPLNPQAKP
ncbi:MAG TPA: hypothetical protein VFC82_01250 [Actinomycetaceae bacterium]|nr:hypothetical protein [Actinomycetaceae bacterium]